MLAVINGKIVTVTNGTLEKGVVLVENGKIVFVGEQMDIPADAQVFDAAGCYVTPGLIDAHTHIGNHCEPMTSPGHADHNESSDPATPHARAEDAFNPFDIGITAARMAGFTTCCVLPGSANVIGGTGFAFKTKKGHTVDDLKIPGSEVMKFALGENPFQYYGAQHKMPMTRMGNALVLREMLYHARLYSEKLQEANGNPEKAPAPDFKLDALVPAVRGEMRCRFHCHRADDIYTAIRISEEFGLSYSIEHATEGFKITEVLAGRKVPCVVGPLVMKPTKAEIWERSLETPAVLDRAGIEICLTEDGCTSTQWLPTYVGMCMANGLSEQSAFRAVTIAPARLLGLDGRMGSIEAGKDADLAIFDGHPFCNFTHCRATVIDGVLFEGRCPGAVHTGT